MSQTARIIAFNLCKQHSQLIILEENSYLHGRTATVPSNFFASGINRNEGVLCESESCRWLTWAVRSLGVTEEGATVAAGMKLELP
jgi:hypothetical protein